MPGGSGPGFKNFGTGTEWESEKVTAATSGSRLNKSMILTIEKFPDSYPVSTKISDFMPCTDAQSNGIHIKYARKTDD